MSEPMPRPRGRAAARGGNRAAGRRAETGGRRVDLLVVLALVLPTVVTMAVVVIGDESTPDPAAQPPRAARLTSTTLICPAARSAQGAGVTSLRAPGVEGGPLQVRVAPVAEAGAPDAVLGEPTEIAVGEAPVAVPGSIGTTVLDGAGAAAPGAVAGRGDTVAIPECAGPVYDEWVVGVGASAAYDTVLEVTNPDAGEAVVDVELLGIEGEIPQPALRGLQVPGGSVRRVDLAAVAPRADVTAARVVVLRGRAGVAARTTRDLLGRGRVTTDFLPADVTGNERHILGIPAKPAEATLMVANPGDDEVRVVPRLASADAVFTSTAAESLVVPPRSMASLELGAVLQGEAAAGVVGLRLESSGPVASSLRVVTADGDLALLAPAPAVSDPAAMALPAGAKTIVLGGARRVGTVTLRPLGADGAPLPEQSVELGPDRTASVPLPEAAVAVTVAGRTGRLSAVATVATPGERGGLATLRLLPPELRSRVPVVRPR